VELPVAEYERVEGDLFGSHLLELGRETVHVLTPVEVGIHQPLLGIRGSDFVDVWQVVGMLDRWRKLPCCAAAIGEAPADKPTTINKFRSIDILFSTSDM
jgi:hypothetical protein